MGGGTGTDGNQYRVMSLEQPWGSCTEEVRIFPPCQVEDEMNHDGPVMIFVKAARANTWKRKQVDYLDDFPFGGFIAWDDKNGEYAWHEIGTIDVPSAKDPVVSNCTGIPPIPSVRSIDYAPIIRGESELVGGPSKSKPSRARRGRPRQRFLNWWASKSRSPETLDFLRKGN